MKTKVKDDFSIGFELECTIKDSISPDQLRRLVRRDVPGTVLHSDYSIHASYGYWPTEIVTPHKPITEAMEVLERMFELIGANGKTNSSCGLHVNISPTVKADWDRMNYIYIAYHPLFKQITRDYRRERNTFAGTNTKPGNLWITAINGALNVRRGKGAAINLSYILESYRNGRRIEVRAFGNTNYHKKLDMTKGYVYEILEVLRKSKIYNFDYMSKQKSTVNQ